MSLAIVYTRANQGVDAPLVTVETHLSNGLPALNMVGLPETAVKESRERVRSAILNAGLEFPARRITINLAPADIPKSGGRYDLAIALSILAASGQLPAKKLVDIEILGELALAGDVRAVQGVVPAVIAARDAGRRLMVPAANADEATMVRNACSVGVDNLRTAFLHFTGKPLEPMAERTLPTQTMSGITEISSVRGQILAKRALLIAAAGGHNMLMVGPPGTGKTLLANAMPGLLPSLDETDALAVAAVRSVAGLRFEPSDWACPPFRAPHHGASAVAIVGGGRHITPGEVTLAHAGILFLDELTEFKRHVLESLREPLEAGVITISRADHRVSFPARFQLVAAMNPCPCGWLGHPAGKCRCTPDQVARYRGKLSGPLLDRIDLMLDVPAVAEADLSARGDGESSATVRERVTAARAVQIERQGKPNALLSPDEIDRHALPDAAGAQLLKQAMARLSLTARAYHRILKVARSIADLAGAAQINAAHVAEAIHYRRGLAD
jgi:magnesium chelatase family protein